ncbi:MAG: hypothetical protein U1F68_10605 [Gammaproteobacteria bacterium]
MINDQITPPKPFTTDHCTWFPDGDYGGCCVEHDRIYWRGGSAEARKAADRALMDCVARGGRPWLAKLMYLGVRIGGHPWLPTSWRWGYGWHWPRSGPST